ncbi:hypothetical protein OEZ86_013801 [Tetradesmus obliquus]|nr:hypothetical protein OEZ86_013801 [Tetradesmus obliquus]
MALPELATAAADLLQWLDVTGTTQVLEHVGGCLCAGGQPTSGAAVPVALQVDATALMCDDVELAAAVMNNTGGVASQAETLINQQLARQAAEGAAAAASAAAGAGGLDIDMDSDESPPTVRLSLQLTQEVTHSARYNCPACGSSVDVLAAQQYLPCCNVRKSPACEDLTGRVMVPAQQLWVTALNSAAGPLSYGTSVAPLLVHVPEAAVGCHSLGAVLHIIGHAELIFSSGSTCSIHVHANSLQQVLPHFQWALPPAGCASVLNSHQQQPLHSLWQLLSTALGFQEQPVDPHLAMALLLSAAGVGGKGQQQQPGAAAEQVSLLVLHDAFAPATPRLLRQAADLLCPQSMAIGAAALAEHITRITTGSGFEGADDAAVRPVFASTLHLANAGIAVADLPTMPAKAKQQLLTALHQRATPLPKGLQQQLPVPLTATCWASTAWQDLPGGAGTADAYVHGHGKQRGQAAAAATAAQAFDLLVADGTVHEDQLFWMLEDLEAPCTQQLAQQAAQQQAAAALRHLLAAAVACQAPVLSAGAQEFLGQYFLVLRQSLGSSGKLSKPVLLATLVRVASAVARLHLRSEVLQQPDASLAVLLMEHTLAIKLGKEYQSVLELPADLNPCNGRSLDEQVGLLHDIVATTFRHFCLPQDDDEAAYQYQGQAEDSGRFYPKVLLGADRGLEEEGMNPLSVWQRGGHPPNECPPGCSSYSIKQEFDGAVVFITGASGYIGSVVLEQLLRTTNVAKVYLLLRPRRGQSIQARADALLQGALFHKVRDSTKLLQKVQVMGGDMSLPGLGLSPADRTALLSSVDFIVHCAADIRLEADIQETLTANFEGTRTVLELAAAAGHLKALVHVSSAFVNMNQPRSSIVDEQVYPLKFGTQAVDVEELAQELLTMPKRDANLRADILLRRWKFPNTYTMGKHMSEQLVTRYQAKQQLPVAIVRPSLVSAIAGEPYPGYVGNWAGPIGAGAAMAIGLFDCLESVASQPMGVWDIVPADLVASSIIAAAAAISAGVAASISRATRSGSIAGCAADAAVVLGQPHPFSPAAHAAHAAHVAEQHAGLADGCSADITSTIKVAAVEHALKPIQAAAAGGHKPAAGAGRAMSAASDDTAMYPGGRVSSLADLAAMVDSAGDSSSSSSSSSPKMRSSIPAGRSPQTSKLTQQLLAAVNVASSTEDSNSNSDELASEGLSDGEPRLPLLIVHAATSSTYPLVLMEGWNYNLDFFEAHPPPFRISFGPAPKMGPDFVPTDANVMACRRRVWWKVWAISTLLRMLGKEKEAKKLVVGYDTFCVHNNSKTDRDLVFSTHALVALEAALAPAEAAEFLLVWRPITKRSSSSSSSSSGSGSGKTKQQQQQWAGRSEVQLAPVDGDVIWRRFLHTQMAGIYRMLFGSVPEQRRMLPSASAAAAAAGQDGQEMQEECFVEHDFRRIK